MATSEGSAHAQWRRFFSGAGGADIFEIIDAAVAVATLDCPAELEQRRERITKRLYTEGILACVDADESRGAKGCRTTAVSKKEDGPSVRSAEKATAPAKNELTRKNSTKPPAAAADRNKAPEQPSEQSMEEATLATAKRRLKERYDDCKAAKRQRMIQVVEAPEMAKQRRKRQHPIIRRRDEVRCAATIGEKCALMSTLRASWV